MALHQHMTTPLGLQRSYADIDIVIGRKEGREAKEAMLELGYVPNDRNHQLGRGDEAGRDELSLDRLCAVTSADWGWYTTLSDNLAKLASATALTPGTYTCTIVIDP